MNKRGRPAGVKLSEDHRLKIANSNILSRLIKAAEGQLEMTPVQAQISLALMRKVFPDLQSVAHTGEDNKGPVKIEVGWAE